MDKPYHPSHGLLQISRVSGGSDNLFGSHVEHHHKIALRVHAAKTQWDLHEDRYYEGKLLLEIELSPVQFAEAITTMNVCPGTPCTVRFLQDMGWIDAQDREASVVQKFRDDFRDWLKKNVTAKFRDRAQQIAGLLDKKSLNREDRKTILETLRFLLQQLEADAPFIHQQFDEAVEKVVVEAKGAIDAFYTHTVMAMGQAALQALPEKPHIPTLEANETRFLENKEQ
jgi:hypothetical protein